MLLLLLAAVAFSTGGYFMKAANGLTALTPSLLVFACFLAGATFQTLAMRGLEMGPVYLFVLGLESVLAFGFSVFLLHESATPSRILAVVLITAGIILLRR
ncbi:MAG: Ethidium bromide-methyl viologen resistance protein EmrE [Bryobacterales bacterium]|nr:Ethidium bromide-methyl viologen resistance protein EmrE [Bryobacterales bacterium]